MGELSRQLLAMPDMRHLPRRRYDQLDFKERQQLLDTAAKTMAWIEEESLHKAPNQPAHRRIPVAKTPIATLVYDFAPAGIDPLIKIMRSDHI